MTNPAAADVWAATNVMTAMATRLLGSDKYLGRDDRTLGSKVGDNAYELFTITPAAEVLALHFNQQQPTFIAVHDIGSGHSTSFLVELASAMKQPQQQLTIRQQGSGTTLAVLTFIELPSPRGVPVRVYSTAAEADPGQRRQIAETLLAFSRLGVLLVHAPSEHLMTAQFGMLRDRVLTVPWNNRDLLLVPRIASPKLEELARKLVDGTLVKVACVGPASSTPSIWNAVHTAWGRLRAGAPGSAEVATPTTAPAPAAPPQNAQASGAPITLRSFGARAAPAPMSARQGFEAYAHACAALHGTQACLIFDRNTRRNLAQAGSSIDPSGWLASYATMLDAAKSVHDGLGNGDSPLDVVSTFERHVLLLRTLPRRADLGMVMVIDKALANAPSLRPQLQRLDAMLDQ
jgi:hypothetical protein